MALSLDLSTLPPRGGSLSSLKGRSLHKQSMSVSSLGTPTPPVDDADLGYFRLDQQRNGPLHRIREEEGRLRRESAQSARPTEAEVIRANGRRSRSSSFSVSSPTSRAGFPTPPLTTSNSAGSPSSVHGVSGSSAGFGGSWRWPSMPATPSSLSPRSSAHYFATGHGDGFSANSPVGKIRRMHSTDATSSSNLHRQALGLAVWCGDTDEDLTDGKTDDEDMVDQDEDDDDQPISKGIRADSPPSFQLES